MLEENPTTDPKFKKTQIWLVAGGLVLFLSALVGGVVFWLKTNQNLPVLTFKPALNSPPLVTPAALTSSTPIQVPFSYTVTEVKDNILVLEGEKGKMRLTTDPTKLHVYLGSKEENPQPADISVVKVGMKAQLKMIPGQEFWLYLKP